MTKYISILYYNQLKKRGKGKIMERDTGGFLKMILSCFFFNKAMWFYNCRYKSD